jgi:hypothetical protein
MADVFRVEGLAETRRAMRQLHDSEGLAEVREGLREAARIVAEDAKGRVPSISGNAAGSIRPTVGGNRAYVNGGKASVPYYGWLDFGSRKPVTGNPRSSGPWAGSGTGPKDGRFIYPAIDARSKDIAEAVGKGLDKTIRKAGFV